MRQRIKNLIFDVGNVLIGYRWQEMFREHGISEEEGSRVGREMFGADIWTEKLDAGYLTVEEAVEEYRRRFPKDGELIAWFLHNAGEMAVPRPEVWEKLAALKERGYRLFLLSNYSRELFELHTEGAAFRRLVDGGIISYQVHSVKPEEEIYRALLGKYGLKAEECLFFDDRKENVEAAERLGIRALRVTSREMINETLAEMMEADD